MQASKKAALVVIVSYVFLSNIVFEEVRGARGK